MMRKSRFMVAVLLVVVFLAVATVEAADTVYPPVDPKGEFGILFGFVGMDENLTGLENSFDEAEPVLGLRAAFLLSPKFTWFVDTTYSRKDNVLGREINMFTLRTGPEYLFPPISQRSRFFLGFGTGLMDVQVQNTEDFDRGFFSASLGQRILTKNSNVWRWELRADRSSSSAGLDGLSMTNYMLLVGFSWNLSGPEADTDGDGVPDTYDNCDCTPAQAEVDSAGCPIPMPVQEPTPIPAPVVVAAPEPEPEPVVPPPPPRLVLDGVNFASDSWELTGGSSTILDKVAASLLAWPAVRVRIDGHTDDTNTIKHNEVLSENRAKAVKDYLAAKGVDPGRMETKGWGESTPIADNASVEGRAVNRRVELVRLDTPQ